MTTDFGLRLREYREAAIVDRRFRDGRKCTRLSQEALTVAAGFSYGYVSRLESGSRTPSPSAIKALADALGLTPAQEDDLMASAGFVTPTTITYATDPTIVSLAAFLNDPSRSLKERDFVRSTVDGILNLAEAA